MLLELHPILTILSHTLKRVGQRMAFPDTNSLTSIEYKFITEPEDDLKCPHLS